MNPRACITSIVLAVAMSMAAHEPADSVNIIETINAGGNIRVSVPADLMQRLMPQNTEAEVADAAIQAPSQAAVRVGYRIQVFDDNNVRTAKHEAQNRKRQLENRFPEFKAYTQFNSPYWRVKVGDFRTRSEAENALAAIKQAFPAYASQLRIVRDRINP